MGKRLFIIGIGTYGEINLTKEASDALDMATLLFGSAKVLEGIDTAGKRVVDAYQPETILPELEVASEENAAVLFSGDTGFYSGAERVISALREKGLDRKLEVSVFPGISSVSAFAAKLGVSWDDAELVSLHGRAQNLAAALLRSKKVFLLAGSKEDAPERILKEIVRLGFGGSSAALGECLGSERERIVSGTVAELEKQKFNHHSIIYIQPKRDERRRFFGLPDDAFLRGKAPMTKSEVCAVILSRLALRREEICYDIGAGTGSVSIEMALAADRGTVYAIEKDADAYELLCQNRDRFACKNLVPVRGSAPEAFQELPVPEVVFIGGSSGKLKEILTKLLTLNPIIHLVLTAVTLETQQEAFSLLRELSFQRLEVVQVSVARAEELGDYHLMRSQNPVLIFSADGGGRNE